MAPLWHEQKLNSIKTRVLALFGLLYILFVFLISFNQGWISLRYPPRSIF